MTDTVARRFARAMAGLRLDALNDFGFRHPARPHPAAHLKSWQHLMREALQSGSCLHLGKLPRPKAMIVIQNNWAIAPGTPVKFLDFELKQADAQAVRWVKREFKKLSAELDEQTMLHVPPSHQSFLPFFESLGFSIESLILTGNVKHCLRNLLRYAKPPVDFSDSGLKVRRIKTVDVPATVSLFRREFRRNPKFGWFCAKPEFLTDLREELKSAAKAPLPLRSHFVILRGTKVLGYFGSTPRPGGFYGNTGGTSLAFDRKIQGKGFAAIAYRILLEDLARRKVSVFRGGTSQPGVLKLSARMERPVTGILLRKVPSPFPRGHFDYPSKFSP